MSDQPLDGESVDPKGDSRKEPYAEALEPSEPWLPPPSGDASAALMLGILGFASCGLLSPLALYYSRRALHEIEASGGSHTGEHNARIGQVMGIIGTTLLVIGLALTLIFGIRAWDFLSDLDLPTRD
jgi:hypothetical protein